jgi:hypothetical protein
VCYVDFLKAFDSVWRSALMYEVCKKGIGGNFHKLLGDMYSNTMYSCKNNNTMSEPFIANRGVKQGDNLSPTLFNIPIYVDDFLEYMISSDTSPAYLDSMSVNHLFFS